MIGAIVGHLVGDYLLQNDWMALNKKKDWIPCAIHCFIWTNCVLLFGGVWFGVGGWPVMAVYWILLLTHAVQDGTNIVRRWMSLIGQEQFATGACSPWSIIVVDNVWHIVTIFVVWKMFCLD